MLTQDDLHPLWKKLLEQMTWYLDNVPRAEMTAAHLNVIRQFLRDNECALNAAHRVPLRKGLEELGDYVLPFTTPTTKEPH